MARDDIYPPDFPLQPKLIEIEGHKIAYFDEGRGDKTLLLLHGNPVGAHVYTRLILLLREHYRCLAPDLLGFGMSDKPAAEEAYSIAIHIKIIAQFVRDLDLNNVVLMVHDWGGPIGFATAVQEKYRYTHLVVLNTLTEPVMRIPGIYKLPFNILRRSDWLADLFIKRFGLFQRMGVGIMEPQDRAVYLRANHNPATRAGIATFPKMIPFSADHPIFPLLRGILDDVVEWEVPTLVLFSDHDSVFSAEDGRRFAAKLKDGRYKTIRGPKHFLQYEAPQEIAGEINEFLR